MEIIKDDINFPFYSLRNAISLLLTDYSVALIIVEKLSMMFFNDNWNALIVYILKYFI